MEWCSLLGEVNNNDYLYKRGPPNVLLEPQISKPDQLRASRLSMLKPALIIRTDKRLAGE